MSKCHDCGHEHRTMAMATRSVPVGKSKLMEDEIYGTNTRFFCHENDHSCYHDRYGKYWDDRAITGPERAAEIITEALRKE